MAEGKPKAHGLGPSTLLDQLAHDIVYGGYMVGVDRMT
jgi:hypothetical protein